ncbi:hypothetical protein [Thiorhodococcus drewsii]|nr:hypothetical protein [Thiorhodococcus drewsii]
MPNHPDQPLVYLIDERANPSTDYFVLPVLRANGYRIVRCGFRPIPDPNQLDGAMVVFVRYVPKHWARLIERVRPRLADLIFFMDDDLFDGNAARGLPWRYRFKLARLATWRRGWLREQEARLWVSTSYLQRKYATWQPTLVSPLPLVASGINDIIRVFYHGSASHAAEIRWLYPVIEAAIGAESRLVFEIIGGNDVHRLYRRLPRTSVVHPMSWPAYQAFIAMPGRHIGLAPLLDRPFNHARSCTKFFDITRSGAVGIYAPGAVCSETVEHAVDGWVASMDQQSWIETILKLAHDESLRQTLLAGAIRKQTSVKAMGV